MPRFYCPIPLASGQIVDLPAGAARHVQVLRLQPGADITLFNAGVGWAAHDATSTPSTPSAGGEFAATVLEMGRSHVRVEIGQHNPVERAAARAVHLAIGMPANERMDWLVEKATELGVASIQPLLTAHSVLRVEGERATKKVAHWQSIAIAACEQCGGNRVPLLHPVQNLSAWLAGKAQSAQSVQSVQLVQPSPQQPANSRKLSSVPQHGLLLSLREGSVPLLAHPCVSAPDSQAPLWLLAGPEGGLSNSEEELALGAGFAAVSLGVRVLRSETAALSALAKLL